MIGFDTEWEDQKPFKHQPPRIAPLSFFSSSPRVSPLPPARIETVNTTVLPAQTFHEKKQNTKHWILNLSSGKKKKKTFKKFWFYIIMDPKPVIHQNLLITWGFLKYQFQGPNPGKSDSLVLGSNSAIHHFNVPPDDSNDRPYFENQRLSLVTFLNQIV